MDNKASEDAFAASLTNDPCPKALSDAVLSILQSYQRKYRAFPGIDWSGITVSAAKSTSAVGMPQCNLAVRGADPLASISFAATTAEANKHPTSALNIFDVVRPADPSVPGRAGTEPACAITQELLQRLRSTGKTAVWTTELRPLDDTIQVANSGPSALVAEWKSHLIRMQRRCADTRSTSARPGDSPDWIIQVDASNSVTDPESTRKILGDAAAHFAEWISGKPVNL
ncbi:hypothetical protein [Nocardia sp. NPDC052566]|uniref:hypothetical protein n=1 Tax=Nocardia sp. NPDC052566 TaxID=3364330 RepID=UPI0037C55359